MGVGQIDAAEEEDASTLPEIPLHQDDPIPHLNLALRTCGHVEQWQHVPGLTAVGREWVRVYIRPSSERVPERP